MSTVLSFSRLINVIKPGTVKTINQSKHAFKQVSEGLETCLEMNTFCSNCILTNLASGSHHIPVDNSRSCIIVSKRLLVSFNNMIFIRHYQVGAGHYRPKLAS